jgi:hypothetical protein
MLPWPFPPLARLRSTSAAPAPCPGGASKILAIAGTDASDQFNEQHGGKSKPAGFLAGFYIGELAA